MEPVNCNEAPALASVFGHIEVDNSPRDADLGAAILLSIGQSPVGPAEVPMRPVVPDFGAAFDDFDDPELSQLLGSLVDQSHQPPAIDPVPFTDLDGFGLYDADDILAGWEVVDTTRRKRPHAATPDAFEAGDDDAMFFFALDMLQPTEVAYVRDERPGRLGFHNLGATCYLASALQLLLHAQPLLVMLEGAGHRVPNPVSVAFENIARRMWLDLAGGESIEVAELLAALHELRGEGFTADRMEDTHDALRMILEMLAAATRPAEGESVLAQLLTSVVDHSRSCVLCHTATVTRAHDREIMVPIAPVPAGEAAASLYDCFREYREPEAISEYACAECDGRTVATSTSRIVEPGDLMVVVLKRFDNAGNKIATPVDIPLVLDMQRATGQQAHASNYQLIGVSHHHGVTKSSGHYVAQFLHHAHGEWVEANDRSVVTSSPPVNSTTAYVILYQRVYL